ncbi:MerR family DNA-binding protein [Jiangella mangrovi]|uniref:DNA-binding transcriptional MerR regulator n=1 Tax=Jiangella mangrovi TaxID=1524084 RepID=A0A7W9GSN0_9ACTN|nr:MerR family DNA-binding protein [Jiangella mangrovi]MBB5789001.1 DNA-binding transcriptional MerR regulator [Jiangella mangrovi]
MDIIADAPSAWPGGGLRSGELAAAAEVNLQTLRYYERRGLLAAPDRTLGGHRVYPPDAVTTVRVIKAAQRLGFTLDEISELVHTGRRHARTDADLHERAAAKIAEIESRIADLVAIRDTLRAALDAGCHELRDCAGSPDCPIPFTGLAHEA